MERRGVSPEAIRRSAEESARASAEIEGRSVDSTHVRTEAVERYIASRVGTPPR